MCAKTWLMQSTALMDLHLTGYGVRQQASRRRLQDCIGDSQVDQPRWASTLRERRGHLHVYPSRLVSLNPECTHTPLVPALLTRGSMAATFPTAVVFVFYHRAQHQESHEPAMNGTAAPWPWQAVLHCPSEMCRTLRHWSMLPLSIPSVLSGRAPPRRTHSGLHLWQWAGRRNPASHRHLAAQAAVARMWL